MNLRTKLARPLLLYTPAISNAGVLKFCHRRSSGLNKGLQAFGSGQMRRTGSVRDLANYVSQKDSFLLEVQHVPVLLDEVLASFSGRQLNTFVDGTVGAGGHASALLAAHPELQRLIGMDIDPTARELAAARLDAQQQRTGSHSSIEIFRKNYSQIRDTIEQALAVPAVDGILLDLGVSSMQLDNASRGFSISRDGPLDMRMGPSAGVDAEQIVNAWPEIELARIFREYGEERHARAYASRIVDARIESPIRTTKQLVAAMGSVGRSKDRQRKTTWKRIHPATRVFQALRIAVNEELRHLERAIPDSINCLAPGGRLAVITFHSLEDRIVKHNFLRAAGRRQEGEAGHPFANPVALGTVVTRKPVVPSEAEQARNPRSRSAKLRIFQKAG